jgi:hypothetical protein
MSWNCLICGCTDQWIRDKEQPEISGMLEVKFDILGDDVKFHTIEKYVVHADSLKKAPSQLNKDTCIMVNCSPLRNWT